MRRLPALFLILYCAVPVIAQNTPKLGSSPDPSAPQGRAVRVAESITPEEMRWESTGSSFPPGSRLAILAGNPGRPVAYAVRIKVLQATTDGPHWHGTDIQITVLQGTLLLGVGDTLDESKFQKFGPGSFLLVPAGLRHFMAFPGEAEYQVQGTGPLRTYVVRAEPPPTLTKAAPAPDPAKMKAEFDAAINAFNQAVQAKDRAALSGPVRMELDRIARAGGPHAAAASDYLSTRLPVELAKVTPAGTCPPIAKSADVGWVVQEIKPGDVVASAFLERRLEWASCAWPDFPALSGRSGLVRLTILVNESGSVIGVKARGGVYPPGVLEAAISAIRNWKTNPPRAQNVPVKTEISVDIPFGN